MPKDKPKAPKTEKMWMGHSRKFGYFPMSYATTKAECERNLFDVRNEAVKVRIMPEAEYQRLIAASKRKDEET